MSKDLDRIAPWLFWLLLTVEVVRQRSFWLTVLGNDLEQQLVAIGSAAAFSGSQYYLAHHSARAGRAFLEAPRQRLVQLLTIFPLLLGWGLTIAAVGATAALDVAMRIGRHDTAAALLTSTGLSTQASSIVLTFWAVLVIAALLASLSAIGIRTADGQAERQAEHDQQHEHEMAMLIEQKNRFQDLYNLARTSIGSGSSIGSSAQSAGKEPDLLNLQCPHCDWTTGSRIPKSSRLALNAHLGRKHRGDKPGSTSTQATEQLLPTETEVAIKGQANPE